MTALKDAEPGRRILEAPRISAAGAAPLIAIFRASTATAAATGRSSAA
jgi:hypothetical protein